MEQQTINKTIITALITAVITFFTVNYLQSHSSIKSQVTTI